MSLKKIALCLWLCVLVLSLSGCGQQSPGVDDRQNIVSGEETTSTVVAPDSVAGVSLTFGVYTADKPSEVVKQFRPILNALEESMSNTLGKPVEITIQVAPSYEAGISDIAQGKVDFSRSGPASYIKAKTTNPALQLLAIESEKGEKVFYGLIAVHQDSDIQTIDNLKGKSFAFGDQLSTIGRYLSQLYLYQSGIKSSDLSRFEYLKRHDTVGTAVGAGEFDAGALKESTFKKLVDKGVPIRELARFPNVTKPWFAHQNMPDEVLQALRQALLAMDDPAALEALGKHGFLEGDDEDYTTIRESIQNNHLFFDDQ